MNMEEIEKQIKENYQFQPKAVVESNKGVFNAECAFQGKHFVISKGHATWEAANQFAENHCRAVRNAMIQAGLNLCTGYPIAKE